jgi:hypothetical protein
MSCGIDHKSRYEKENSAASDGPAWLRHCGIVPVAANYRLLMWTVISHAMRGEGQSGHQWGARWRWHHGVPQLIVARSNCAQALIQGKFRSRVRERPPTAALFGAACWRIGG